MKPQIYLAIKDEERKSILHSMEGVPRLFLNNTFAKAALDQFMKDRQKAKQPMKVFSIVKVKIEAME